MGRKEMKVLEVRRDCQAWMVRMGKLPWLVRKVHLVCLVHMGLMEHRVRKVQMDGLGHRGQRVSGRSCFAKQRRQ